MEKILQGRRVYPDEDGEFSGMNPGEYGFAKDRWLMCLPTGIIATVTNKIWKITEHEDGTITVHPSILTTSREDPGLNWHGFLVKGVFRSC